MALQLENYDPARKYGAVSEETDLAITEGYMLIGDSNGKGSELDVSGDTKILVGNATTATSVAMSGDATMSNAGAVTIANDAVNEAKTADSDGTGGLYVKKTALAVYDFSVDGGTQGAVTLADTATLPDNAVVTASTYEVVTTCTSSTDAATIAVTLPTDGAVTTAIAISDGSNPWDQGIHAASVITPIPIKTTAARAIGITIAGGQDITAGKVIFSVDYFVSV